VALGREEFIPVIAPVGVDADGNTYNINADVVAGQVAGALDAEKLILLTDVEGVKAQDGRLFTSLNAVQAERHIGEGAITGGMIPKINCCLAALHEGVRSAHIIDGRVEHALLLEIFTDGGIGTQIMRHGPVKMAGRRAREKGKEK